MSPAELSEGRNINETIDSDDNIDDPPCKVH